MGYTIAEKIIKAHLVEGELVRGQAMLIHPWTWLDMKSQEDLRIL